MRMKAVTREQVRCKCMDQDTCKENLRVKFLDGSSLPSIPYLRKGDYHRGEWSKKEPCHGCGCLPGQFHHPSCDMEICPRCKQQAIRCDCLNDWEAKEKQEKQERRRQEKQAEIRLRQRQRHRRERWRQILKKDAKYRRLYKAGYILLCNGGPAPIDFSDIFLQATLRAKGVRSNDVVQCSTMYDEHGQLMPGDISLWAKVPKMVFGKSKKTR